MTASPSRLPKRKMSPTPSHVRVLAISGPCSSHGAQGWACLARRGLQVFPVLGTGCGKPMRIIAFVTEVGSVQHILEYLGEPTTPPPIASVRDP